MAASGAPRPKKSRTSEEEEEDARSVDRLSNLPDSILASIFSAMDTKLAVQTCVLSKRYEDLWRTNTHALNFNSKSFRRKRPFDKFVSNFLSRRDRSYAVSSLSYRRAGSVESRAFTRVVKYAVARNVQHLDIHAASKRGELPPDVFANKHLKTLHLRCSGNNSGSELVVPVRFSLPNLTTLHLDSVDFRTSPTTSTACSLSLSACANLKNLKIVYVESLDVVCPPQLTSLTIRSRDANSKIVVKGLCKLTTFNYQGSLHKPPSFSSDNHLSSLENVRIDGTSFPRWKVTDEAMQAIAKDNCTMLQEICSAKFVTLSKEVLELIITTVPEHSPSPFANLKSAKVTDLQKDYDQNLIDQFKNYLLSSSPDATFVVEGLQEL